MMEPPIKSQMPATAKEGIQHSPGRVYPGPTLTEIARIVKIHGQRVLKPTGKPLEMRRFILNRLEDVSGVSGTGVVAEGVVFSDGRTALRWTCGLASTALYDSVDELVEIHGHNGSTQVVWIDE